MDNFYRRLEVLPTATPDEIKEAYSRLRAKLTAIEMDNAELTSKISDLEDAYAILSNSSERANYDRSLSASNSNSQTSLTVLDQPSTILRPEVATPLVQQPCPYCGVPNPIQATMCKQCGQQISRPCPNCGHIVQLGQSVCPRCNTFLSEYDQRRLTQALIVEHKIQIERLDSESKVQALEAGHRVRAAQGGIFWIIVGLGCIILSVVPFLLVNYILNQP
jgi:hypothetical protein